jgi:hypothetical protein
MPLAQLNAMGFRLLSKLDILTSILKIVSHDHNLTLAPCSSKAKAKIRNLKKQGERIEEDYRGGELPAMNAPSRKTEIIAARSFISLD